MVQTAPDLRETVQDTRNIAHSYDQELAWKRTRLKEDHWYIGDLVRDGDRSEELCGAEMIRMCAEFEAENGRLATVLDVGCGPVSSYSYLSHHGLADLTGVDPISPRYAKLLSKFSLAAPAKQQKGSGENLVDMFGAESFDIVACRNALDHHLCPALAWMNMYRVAKVGGYVVHSHSIREATKEKWKQLHQYDLFPSDDDQHMFVEDTTGDVLNLTAGLDLEYVTSAINRNESNSGWFSVVYRKTGSNESAELLAGVLRMAGRSLDQRHRWALSLERKVNKTVRLGR